jgi:acrylyl-CoA reductase (NADPH)
MEIDQRLFCAFEVSEKLEGTRSVYAGQVVQKRIADLPVGDVLVKLAYSSLNYKDALSATGNRGVTRSYPHVPGIDAAGTVMASSVSRLQVGDPVIVTGHDLGMNTSGGFAQYIRVPADWVVQLPAGMSLRQSMALGTAGLTAALCVDRLLHNGLTPDRGDVVVTGATGGVGSIAVALLGKLGFAVTACTGKPQEADYLRTIGAQHVICRADVLDVAGRPLLKERWAGAIDVAGGALLSSIIRSLSYGGSVACCGLVSAAEFPVTTYPFILRNVNLLGVDSVSIDFARRCEIWRRLALEWQIPHLEIIGKVITFKELDAELDAILKGEGKGRRILDVCA